MNRTRVGNTVVRYAPLTAPVTVASSRNIPARRFVMRSRT